MFKHKMDELTQYLKSDEYKESKFEQILNKKIIITEDHIKNINFKYYNFDIINLFEKYGYIFTDGNYKIAVQQNGYMLKYIPDDKKTYEICTIAVKQIGWALKFVPDNKKTYKICKIAVQQTGWALCFVPENNKTNKLCENSVRHTGWALKFGPEDKKTDEICKIAVEQISFALRYIPNNKKHLFITN